MSAEEAVVVDTNVAVVANGKAEQAGPECMSTCIETLRQIQEGRFLLLLDNRNEILQEYRGRLHPSGKPGSGDAFFKWLWRVQADERYCRKVPITPHECRGFEEFPDDPDLASFDRDDRMFVAVALASGSNPQVLNAADTDWWEYCERLRKHGVEIVFLCPELMPAEG